MFGQKCVHEWVDTVSIRLSAYQMVVWGDRYLQEKAQEADRRFAVCDVGRPRFAGAFSSLKPDCGG